jgi:hypothetical protein
MGPAHAGKQGQSRSIGGWILGVDRQSARGTIGAKAVAGPAGGGAVCNNVKELGRCVAQIILAVIVTPSTAIVVLSVEETRIVYAGRSRRGVQDSIRSAPSDASLDEIANGHRRER